MSKASTVRRYERVKEVLKYNCSKIKGICLHKYNIPELFTLINGQFMINMDIKIGRHNINNTYKCNKYIILY